MRATAHPEFVLFNLELQVELPLLDQRVLDVTDGFLERRNFPLAGDQVSLDDQGPVGGSFSLAQSFQPLEKKLKIKQANFFVVLSSGRHR